MRAAPLTMVLAVLVLAPAAARGYLPPPYGGDLTVPLPDRPLTLDPARATRESELQLIGLLFDTLYRLTPEGIPREHLVEPGPRISADGRSWRLQLRPGVLLHDGRTLQAAQVVTALQRALKGPQGYLLGPVRAVQTDGQRGILLKLGRPAPELPWLLCTPASAVVVREGSRLIGSGPFKLGAGGTDRFELRAHPQHFAGRPYLNRVLFKVFARSSAEVASFQLGSLQVSLHGVRVFGGTPRYAYQRLVSPAAGTLFLALGKARPALANPQLRRALLAAIDRRRLARLAGAALPARGPVSPRLMRQQPRRVPFNRAAARRALARAAARDEDLRRLRAGERLSLLVDASRFEDTTLANQIVADLDRVGIAATIQPLPATRFSRRLREGRFELALVRQVVQTPLGPVALAGAMSLAREPGPAAACLGRGRCGPREARAFMTRLPLVPLVHAPVRLHHDARLGGLRFSASGLVAYDAVYWLRQRP